MLPSWAWSQGRQISLPRAILSSPPDGGTSATSLLESSTHTPQTHPHPQPGSQMSFLLCLRSAKAPFRAFNLQIVFVRLTHHPCSTSEDVTAPTPHTPFARCHQGVSPWRPPRSTPRSCCGSWCAAGRGSRAMVSKPGPGLRVQFCRFSWWPWARVLPFPRW